MAPLVFLLLIGALTLPTISNPTSLPNSKSCTTMSFKSIEKAFSDAVREKRVPGISALALNRDGSVIFKGSWGNIDINNSSSPRITSRTTMPIASMTKAVVSVAALQLIEQGRLKIDDLVEKFLPLWKEQKVLEGWTEEGEPILRRPRVKATIRHLFTHTTGQGYFFLNEDALRYTTWASAQSNTTAVPPLVPLLDDPGRGWYYGMDTDTLGNIIEAISGQRLDDYIEEHILHPLGIRDSGMITPQIFTHQRLENGTITSAPPTPLSKEQSPWGGGYLTSSIDSYSKFLLALITDGALPRKPNTRILKPTTIKKYIFKDFISNILPSNTTSPLGAWNSVAPTWSNSYSFFPGKEKGWSAAFLLNNEPHYLPPTSSSPPGEKAVRGRSAGSGTWAGIHNLYYWVDPKEGKLGVLFTNLMPFLDEEVLGLLDELERGVYSCGGKGERGRN